MSEGLTRDGGHPGVRQGPLEEWFAKEIPDAVLPLSFNLLAGGHSNLTYRVVDRQDRSWVLRRPPEGPVPPGAHSMEREWRILSALQTSRVPVPPVAAFCGNDDVIGAEFYVMNHVDGIVVDSAADASAFNAGAPTRLAEGIVVGLAELHDVDVAGVGRRLDPNATPYVTKQLDLWMRQIRSDGAPRTAEIVEAHELLRQSIPPQRSTTLTHGDYRLGNLLVSTEGHINAVLDWELWTVGDPLADLGWLAAWWALQADDGWSPETDQDFPDASELVSRYQQLTLRDTSDISYYTSFALWRLACISEGVYQRYVNGVMGKIPASLDDLADRPRKLAVAALDVLR